MYTLLSGKVYGADEAPADGFYASHKSKRRDRRARLKFFAYQRRVLVSVARNSASALDSPRHVSLPDDIARDLVKAGLKIRNTKSSSPKPKSEAVDGSGMPDTSLTWILSRLRTEMSLLAA